MTISLKTKVTAAAVAGAAIAGGGAAIAAGTFDSPEQESQAIVNDAAKQLGVQPSALTNALRKAVEDRIDAAVAADRLTKAEGDALKQRVESGDAPLLFGGIGRPHGPRPFGGLQAAASYLGLTQAQLRTKLEGGSTLAQAAKDAGKSVDGLEQALLADAKTKLDAAVAAGRLTSDREQAILSDLKQHVTDLVNGTAPPRLRPDGPRPERPWFGAPRPF